MGEQSQEIPGTAVFTGERSQRGYKLNRLAMSLTDPANRARFLADEPAYMREMGLDDEEIDIVRRRDWEAMIEHGGSVYLMLKIAATVGQTLLQMGAQMRHITLPELMASMPGAAKGH